MILGKSIQHKMILCLLSGAFIFNGSTVKSYASTIEATMKRKPLRIVIRPRAFDNKLKKSIADPETFRRFNEGKLDYNWANILNNKFFSGYEHSKILKKSGFSTNLEIGSILMRKLKATDDPDNLLHLTDYRDKQLYGDVTVAFIGPMQEIKQGCKIKTPEGCGFSRFGQFWLKANLTYMDNSRARSDEALVNLIKSLD